jgi:predicted kinase
MLETPHLHLLCGKAGAGKSALAQGLAASTGALLISEDVWLSRLYGEQIVSFEDYLRCAQRLRTVVVPLVTDVLRQRSVVLDFPANTVASRGWLRSLIDAARVPHTLHWLEASDALCLQRIARRNVERPEGSHELSEAMFHHITSFFQPPGEDEGFRVQRHPQS